MLLGTLIERLESERGAAAVLDALGDIVLTNAAARMADHCGLTPAEYAADAVARFSVAAGDEDWLRLVSTIEKSDDPARALLAVMLRWALDRDANEDGSSACGCGGDHACS